MTGDRRAAPDDAREGSKEGSAGAMAEQEKSDGSRQYTMVVATLMVALLIFGALNTYFGWIR